MKNFPHQINDIPKLVTALSVFHSLLNKGEDVFDDEIYGYALARGGVYTFRNPPPQNELEERISQEKKKKPSDQGARTCARDLRNFFSKMNAIEKSSDFQGITEIGLMILAAGANLTNANTRLLWQECLRNIEATDISGNTSHPYVILLKLVIDDPGIKRERLAVALDAVDDSETEYQRVLELEKNSNWYSLLDGSTAQKANAVKILPSLAQQVGDVEVKNHSFFYPINSVILTPVSGRKVLFAVPRNVIADNIASVPTFQDDETEALPTLIDYTSSAKLIKARTIRHQLLVKHIARILENCKYELSENPMDCLATKDDHSLLIEVKTINANKSDEGKQVRLALGQLTYYERFFVDSSKMVQKIALFDSQISLEHIEYLENYRCFVLWKDKTIINGSTNALQYCLSNKIILS